VADPDSNNVIVLADCDVEHDKCRFACTENGAAEFGLSTLQRRNDEERPVADASECSAFVN
jgi:hypothetical protein